MSVRRVVTLTRQLEIETYTWDVLPEHLKTGDIVDYVVPRRTPFRSCIAHKRV
ncbi:MAG: hypothetical protein Q7R41_18160 [Phycisphaerales bacterium]|nr:hypothetical protein [Phycisphaerales bacterium]